jgi:prolyl oligopeptidase PreP (S9A serine peptidase family)
LINAKSDYKFDKDIGHAGASTNEQAAKSNALAFAYL